MKVLGDHNMDTNDISFPVPSGIMRRDSQMTMDEYDEFNRECIANFFDEETYRKEKKRREVHAPFIYHDDPQS